MEINEQQERNVSVATVVWEYSIVNQKVSYNKAGAVWKQWG